MHYALPEKEKYPIETEEQVKLANDYFGKYIEKFHPIERASIASNIEKRAEAMNVNLDSGWVSNYARRTSYSPDFDIHMSMRKKACADKSIKISENKMVKAADLLQKLADNKDAHKPKDMIYALAQFDKLAGLESRYDKDMRDPIFTVFGSSNNPGFDIEKLSGGINEKQLKIAASNEAFIQKLASTFGNDFSRDFKNSPMDIFKSMPDPEKQMIAGFVKNV
ncbi:MAG TPA: hypothetical protein VMV86_06100 [Methanosarcinales archaeon]|nr:hypothetical protein [Methanosarcinales archaeon]